MEGLAGQDCPQAGPQSQPSGADGRVMIASGAQWVAPRLRGVSHAALTFG